MAVYNTFNPSPVPFQTVLTYLMVEDTRVGYRYGASACFIYHLDNQLPNATSSITILFEAQFVTYELRYNLMVR